MAGLFTAGATLLFAAAVVLVTGERAAVAATSNAQVQDFSFSPATINISAGDSVEWTFAGAFDHNVTAVDGSFASATMTSGSFQHTFSQAGTVAYYCTIHGDAQGNGMAGTIVVASAATNTPQATDTPAPTNTREPTETAEASATAASSTPLPLETAAPGVSPAAGGGAVITATPSGLAADIVAAPNAGAGTGSSERSPLQWMAMVLALCGVACAGAAITIARRRIR